MKNENSAIVLNSTNASNVYYYNKYSYLFDRTNPLDGKSIRYNKHLSLSPLSRMLTWARFNDFPFYREIVESSISKGLLSLPPFYSETCQCTVNLKSRWLVIKKVHFLDFIEGISNEEKKFLIRDWLARCFLSWPSRSISGSNTASTLWIHKGQIKVCDVDKVVSTGPFRI